MYTTTRLLILLLVNIVINIVLKEIIQELRPNCPSCSLGMPSGHAQLAFFLAGYSENPLMFVLASLIAISRVIFGYHTVNQVIVGSIIGYLLSLTKSLFVV